MSNPHENICYYPEIHRLRKAYITCIPCRDAKIKCDKNRPICGRCMKKFVPKNVHPKVTIAPKLPSLKVINNPSYSKYQPERFTTKRRSSQPQKSNTAQVADNAPSFNVQENYIDITYKGSTVTPTIEAEIQKGFFWSSDRVWTCYRRNYFAVSVSFGLDPWIANGRLYLNQGGSKGPEQIQSMAMSLSAAVDGTSGKSIELIQLTPKRDKGPQLPVKRELLSPTPPGRVAMAIHMASEVSIRRPPWQAHSCLNTLQQAIREVHINIPLNESNSNRQLGATGKDRLSNNTIAWL
ncbi:p53-like transcription factor [Zopfia rhizophila CBS 207.26]|uniref:p53-like transcription factor n=1 Tax=Zopfia rhizophila CBS 207.26 TaxID=1314779 RepID=A0A6A6EGV1_9PEZI|nr:p53-like transcription factor [Zopfia rhizophila CBS 207.26]